MHTREKQRISLPRLTARRLTCVFFFLVCFLPLAGVGGGGGVGGSGGDWGGEKHQQMS